MLQGFYEISQSLRHIMSGFDGFRLHHHADQGFRAGGTHQNATFALQRLLLPPNLLPQALIAHNVLFGAAYSGNGHVDQLLGVLGAAGHQLGGRHARLAVGLNKLQSRQLAVAGGGELSENGSKWLPIF